MKMSNENFIYTVRRMKMKVLFLEYPKCTTCKKAKKWLEEHKVDFEDRDIKDKNPTAEELKTWYQKRANRGRINIDIVPVLSRPGGIIFLSD